VAAVTVLRPPVSPGEVQIDYGHLGRWLDPIGNRVRRVSAFVVVLACSEIRSCPSRGAELVAAVQILVIVSA
jgi:hypothetical protein